jgi:hypothetical protein
MDSERLSTWGTGLGEAEGRGWGQKSEYHPLDDSLGQEEDEEDELTQVYSLHTMIEKEKERDRERETEKER